MIVLLLLCVHVDIDSQISFDCRIVLLLTCALHVCLLCVLRVRFYNKISK